MQLVVTEAVHEDFSFNSQTFVYQESDPVVCRMYMPFNQEK